MKIFWIILGLLVMVLVCLSFYFVYDRNRDNKLDEADESYREAEMATTIAQRKVGFNQALSFYNELEKKYHPSLGSGRLYYNLGNTYFQLEEYPWALLNYYRAQALMPRHDKIDHNLNLTLKKLFLPIEKKDSTFNRIFFFHTRLSLPERLQLFFLFGILTFVLSSAYIWWKNTWLKRLCVLTAIFCTLFLLSIAYTHYLSPISAVLIKASDLYRDAGKQYATVSDQPIQPGVKVDVLNVYQEGKWVKIRTPNGTLGYVPYDLIRFI